MEKEYVAPVSRLAANFDLSEAEMRRVLERAKAIGMFSDQKINIDSDAPSLLVQVENELKKGYGLRDESVDRVIKILTPDYEGLKNGSLVSVKTVADKYGIPKRELLNYLFYAKSKRIKPYGKPTELAHINKEQAAKWTRPNPFLNANEGNSILQNKKGEYVESKLVGNALVTDRVPEIISGYLEAYLLTEGNHQPMSQVIYRPLINFKSNSISLLNNAGGGKHHLSIVLPI